MKLIVAVTLVAIVILAAFAGQSNAGADVATSTTKESASSIISRQPRSEIRDNRGVLMHPRFGRKPKKKDLDRDNLMEILGGSYEKNFLSEEEPETLTEISPTMQLDQDGTPSQITKQILEELELLNLTSELLGMGEEQAALNAEHLVAFKGWLLRKVDCPVHYTWKDIGPYYWPRWLKKGQCSSSTSNCSWPSGMYCVPGGTISIQILRWQCPSASYRGKRRNKGTAGGNKGRGGWRRGSSPEKKRCHWLKVPYPIINACICRC